MTRISLRKVRRFSLVKLYKLGFNREANLENKIDKILGNEAAKLAHFGGEKWVKNKSRFMSRNSIENHRKMKLNQLRKWFNILTIKKDFGKILLFNPYRRP